MNFSKPEIFSVFLLSAFILTMISFIIVMIFTLQNRRRGFQSDLLALRANFDKELYKAQLEIQEQTFQDISREIHDNVGQMLSLARLGIDTLDLQNQNEARQGLRELSEIVENALNDLRHMSRSLNNEIVKNVGLEKSIEKQVKYIQKGGKYNVRFDVKGQKSKIDENKQILLFRIVQESLNNILKHATASDIVINIEYLKDQLSVKIEDNGQGFQLADGCSQLQDINGIQNMRQRASLINARLNIVSEIGRGTTVTVLTPL